jgi:hypothetical protein
MIWCAQWVMSGCFVSLREPSTAPPGLQGTATNHWVKVEKQERRRVRRERGRRGGKGAVAPARGKQWGKERETVAGLATRPKRHTAPGVPQHPLGKRGMLSLAAR